MNSPSSFNTKILILDDNETARALVINILKELGNGIILNSAETFEKALTYLTHAEIEQAPYKFIVADLAVETKTVERGIDWIREVTKTRPEIKIVAVSGKDTNAFSVLKAGAFAFFRKPFLDGLKETILYSQELEELNKSFSDSVSGNISDSLTFFKDIVEKMPAGISIVDRRMKVLYMNRRQREMSGYKDFETYDGLCYEVFAKGATDKCPNCPVVNLFSRKNEPLSGTHMRGDGYHEITAFPLFDGKNKNKMLAAVKVAVDVTSREEFANFKHALEGKLRLGDRIFMVLNAVMSRGYKRARMLLITDSGEFIESYCIAGDRLDDFSAYLSRVKNFSSVEQVLSSGRANIFPFPSASEPIPCWQRTDQGISLLNKLQYGLVPMIYMGKGIGVIYVDNYENYLNDPDITRSSITITRDGLEELTDFAAEAAKAIVESRRINTARQAIELLEMDREVFEQQLKGRGLFQSLLDNCIRIIKGQFRDGIVPKEMPEIYGHVMLAEGNRLLRVTRVGGLPDFGKEWHLNRDTQAFCVKAFNNGEEIYCNNLESEPEWNDFLKMLKDNNIANQGCIDIIKNFRSFICFPLMDSDKVVGTLSLQSPVINLFNDTVLDLARAFVQRTSQAVAAFFDNLKIRRFPEMSEAMSLAKSLYDDSDRERTIFTLLSSLTHNRGMAFNRAIFWVRDGDLLQPNYAIGPEGRVAGEHLYAEFEDQGNPSLGEILKGDIRFDKLPKGLNALSTHVVPEEVCICCKGEHSLPEEIFDVLDVPKVVFFPIKVEKSIYAAVLLDNFITGKEPSGEKLDVLNATAIDYATILKNQTILRRMEDESKKKEELLHVLAHRLKTDLLGPYEWINRANKHECVLDKKQLSIIAEKMRITHTAVNDILRFAVIESANLREMALFVPTDLESLLASALQEVFTEKVERVVRNIPKGLKIIVDGEMFKHALFNLLDNAVLYSKKDSDIEINAKYIAEAGTGLVQIVISSEPQLPPREDEWQKMFDKFFRGENARFAKGTGLGLYVVDHIIQAHGGRVQASPENNGRISFIISIPASN